VLKGQLPLSERGLSGQGVKLFGRGEALLNSVCKLPFAQHVHQLNAGEGGLRGVERFAPSHRPGDPLHPPMILFNGMITNDKFCLIRQGQVQLRWSRQPYRFRPRTSGYLLDEPHHREGSHETPLAATSAIPANDRRGTAMGSGVPMPASMDDNPRAVRHALTISQTTEGGNT
jgi:hypothetical protein